MKRTKQARLIACFDAYQQLVGGRPCTADEVSEWVMAGGLWPVPTVRDHELEQTFWEARFEEHARQPIEAVVEITIPDEDLA